MRRSLLQRGFSILLGWFIVFVSYVVIQPNIHPPEAVLILGLLLLGVSLMGLGFIKKAKTSSPRWAKTLLQIGVVVTIIWVMIQLQRGGPYDLGLPKLSIPLGPHGSTPLVPLLLFLVIPVLGVILLVLGVVLKRRTEETNLEDGY